MERPLPQRGPVVVAMALAIVASATAGGVAAAANTAVTGDQVSTTETTASTVTLTVTVVDPGGNPLGNAELTATWDGGGPVTRTTASNGKAFLDVAEGKNVTIRVDHPNYIRNNPFVVENATAGDVRITVWRRGRATITVVDDDGPVENAIVRLFRNGTVVNERTNDNGVVRTGDIERAPYTLVSFKQGYLRNTTTLEVGANTQKTVAIETGSVLVSLDVTDDHFDPPKPVANASVTVEGIGTVSTLGNGEATISVPVNRDFTVSVTKDGYRSASQSLSIRESPESLNFTIQRERGATIVPANERVVIGETVRVTVVNEYDEPLENVSVELDGSAVGRTNDQGAIDVPIESAGNHTISMQGKGRRASTTVTGVEPAPDETPTPTPTPTPVPTTTEPSSGLGPGLGVSAAVVALFALTVLALRRER